MAFSKEFCAFVIDLLEPLGPVQSKRMFGGAGLYLDGTIFALLFGDELYLKVDDQNREDFVAEGMEPFTPFEDGSTVLKSYHQCPAHLLDDPDDLCQWARASWEAGRRVQAANGKKGNKKKRSKS